jgi:hypothetical protein
LKKTNDMIAGAVSYHRPENVKRMSVEKNNSIVRQIEKTKVENHPDLAQIQQDRDREIQRAKKNLYKQLEKKKQIEKLRHEQEKEQRSYDRIMRPENMTAVSDIKATVDATAAEEYEADFF